MLTEWESEKRRARIIGVLSEIGKALAVAILIGLAIGIGNVVGTSVPQSEVEKWRMGR